jgi:hypothetical protein
MTEINDIKDELERLNDMRKNNNWFDPRNPDNYILEQYNYSFGDRNYYRVSDENYQFYKDLQASRGIDDLLEKNINDYLSDFESSAYSINNADEERISELERFLDFESLGCFYELGFRTPRLLNYWNDRGLCVKGYDVVRANVLVSSFLGWDAEEYDLSLCESPLGFDEDSLIVSYHCFEHLVNPLMTLTKVYNAMAPNSFFHIEVPIESQQLPNLRYAHLQTFHTGDLETLLTKEVGFEIINHTSRHDVDRFLVVKK